MTTNDARELMREYGLAVVPIKPSPEMLITAIKLGNVSTEVAWNIYNAMLEAFRAKPDYMETIAMMVERNLPADDRPQLRGVGNRARGA